MQIDLKKFVVINRKLAIAIAGIAAVSGAGFPGLYGLAQRFELRLQLAADAARVRALSGQGRYCLDRAQDLS